MVRGVVVVVADDDSWGIWVDVEGFSNLWSAGALALRGLRQLTSLIYAIGTRAYPNDPERLFAHQIGDGFYIASDFHEHDLDRCAAIAVVIMRGMTEVGCVARASLAEGSLADYSGYRPREVQLATVRNGDNDLVSLGSGQMTLQAVMGQGIINAVALDKLTQTKGALLSIDRAKVGRLSPGFVVRPIDKEGNILAIDWIHSTSTLIDEISSKAAIASHAPAVLSQRLKDYIAEQRLSPLWSEPTLRFAGLAHT